MKPATFQAWMGLDLSMAQLKFLLGLAEAPGPIGMEPLSVLLKRMAPNITVHTNNLEAKGLVQRCPRSTLDRRLQTISLTEAGGRLLAELFPTR